MQERLRYRDRRDRLAVVVADRLQALDEPSRKVEADEVEDLAVSILLDDVDAFVARNELADLFRQGQRTQAAILDPAFAGDVRAVVAALLCPAAAGQIFHGTGTVVAALPRLNRLIVNHPEIKGFMPAMEMSYAVSAPTLLEGVKAGDEIEFDVDAGSSTITRVKVIGAGK